MNKTELRIEISNRIVAAALQDPMYEVRYVLEGGKRIPHFIVHKEVYHEFRWPGGVQRCDLPIIEFMKSGVIVKSISCSRTGKIKTAGTVCRLSYDFITDDMINAINTKIMTVTNDIISRRQKIALRKFRKAQKND